MNAETRDDNRRKFDEAPVKNETKYKAGIAMTRDILSIARSDQLERTFGRLKWTARMASAVLFSIPIAAEVVTRTSELVGHAIEQDSSVPNLTPCAIGTYVVSRLFRGIQNLENDESTFARTRFVQQYGDMGVGAVQELRMNYDSNTMLGRPISVEGE